MCRAGLPRPVQLADARSAAVAHHAAAEAPAPSPASAAFAIPEAAGAANLHGFHHAGLRQGFSEGGGVGGGTGGRDSDTNHRAGGEGRGSELVHGVVSFKIRPGFTQCMGADFVPEGRLRAKGSGLRPSQRDYRLACVSRCERPPVPDVHGGRCQGVSLWLRIRD